MFIPTREKSFFVFSINSSEFRSPYIAVIPFLYVDAEVGIALTMLAFEEKLFLRLLILMPATKLINCGAEITAEMIPK